MVKNLRPFLIVSTMILVVVIAAMGLGKAIVPLTVAFALAYLVFPLILKFEIEGVPRAFAVIGVLLLCVVAVVVAFWLIVPALVADAKGFVGELPYNFSRAVDKLDHLAAESGYELNLSRKGVKEFLIEQTSSVSAGLVKNVWLAVGGVFSNLTRWLLALLNLLLIPLFFFYVVHDYENLTENIKSFIPKPWRPMTDRYFAVSDRGLSGFLRGQLMVAALLGLLYGVGLTVVGLRFGFLLGLASGLVSVVPLAGFVIGFSMSMMMALANFDGMGTIVGVLIVFMLVQALDGTVITPKLVGDKVGLGALATILALIIGGNLLGLFGMLVAVPFAGVLKVVLSDLKREYQNLNWYRG